MQDSFLRSYPYQSLAAQVVGYVGAISPAQYKARKKKGYQATDSIGQAGVESTYDTYLRGKDGKAQLTVDSRGRPKGAAGVRDQPDAGPGAAADDRHQPAACRRARASLRHQPGALELRGPARERRRDRRAQPEGRCGARDGVVPDLQAVDLRRPQGSAEARAAAQREGRRRRQPPGLQPRDQRRLSAGLDVQAGDGARGDAGRADEAVRRRSRARRRSRITARRSRTGRR